MFYFSYHISYIMHIYIYHIVLLNLMLFYNKIYKGYFLPGKSGMDTGGSETKEAGIQRTIHIQIK